MPLQRKKRGLPKKPSAFLAAYVLTASITKAAKAARVDRGLHYRWLKDDDAYVIAFAEAEEQAAQTLEDEAVRRAHEGVSEPLVYQRQFSYKQRAKKDGAGNDLLIDGKKQYESYGAPICVNKKSDTLMMFLLKGFRPDRYRDRVSAELSGPDGGPIPTADETLANLSEEELEALLALSLKLKPKT